MEAAVKKPFILGLVHANYDIAFTETAALNDRVGHNTGNLAFQSAVVSHFGHGLATNVWSAPPEQINTMGSVGVIPAANQFGAHVDYSTLAQRFEKIQPRLVMIGLGAQSDIDGRIPTVPEGTVNWVRQIGAHGVKGVPNISVRGPFTKTVLEHYGLGDHAIVMGCPSLFLNPDPELGARIAANVRPIRRVAVAAGLPYWPKLRDIERSLVRILTDTGGSYVGQHGLDMIRLTRGEAALLAPEKLEIFRAYLTPDLDTDAFIAWCARHGDVFFDVQHWMEYYRHFDFVIGARIHGVMLALQAGVPGICIAHDSRTQELCQTMMVPYVLASEIQNGVQLEDLPGLFTRFDAAAFDANRRMLAARYIGFLEGNGLDPVAWLKGLTG